MAEDSAQTEPTEEDQDLVSKVDDMMAPVRRNPNPAPPQGPYQPKKVEPTTAPPLHGVYKPKTVDKPPIVIELKDDITPAKTVPAIQPEEPADEVSPQPQSSTLDDQKTDEAVDAIAAQESDTVLAVEDARAARKARSAVAQAQKPGFKARSKAIFKSKWTWLAVVALIVAVFALPLTRYKILGLAIKKSATISVVDSKTGTPVSGADVEIAGASTKTDAEGKATLKAPLGKHDLKISKQYYQDSSSSYFVGFKLTAQAQKQTLVATGRLVPVTVTNRITGKPIKGVEIKVKGTTAKTDASGLAHIALPATAGSYDSTITLDGYNALNVKVQVTDQVVKANNFQLTPTGQIYFLSNASGTIDVVKTNLDGSGRKTVVSGTGHETSSTTNLLATRDWRYLVLEANRDGSKPALYLLDTSNDKLTEFENSGADIKLVGWYGHNFVYDLTKTSQSNWQTGREVLKSYDADHQQPNQLDQSQAEGTASSYAYQNFDNFYIINGQVVYSTLWNTYTTDSSAYNTTGKTDSIRAVSTTGQNKKDYQTLPINSTGYIQSQLFEPQGVYFAVVDSTNGGTNYYQYENQSVKTADINNGTFAASYPAYLFSPSGQQTLWSELRDGQNTLFSGDGTATTKKQLLAGSYSPYGWYTNNYLIVSKNNSQLYVIPAAGLSQGQTPTKITDYYKPAQTFEGYGYGYGGL